MKAMKKDILAEEFSLWTKNLPAPKDRISIFEHIRDIPYAIIPELRDPQVGPAGLLELKQGSCQPKHFLLAIFFQKLNIPTKYVTYPFYWFKLNVKYPLAVKKILSQLPSAYHLACKVYLDGRWVLLDATYDPALKKAGFPVNLAWDGTSDTLNAVLPEEEIIHENLQERVDYERQKRSLYTEKEKIIYAGFVKELNQWLQQIRG